jgi:PAS domain S-box-containing protein
MLEPGEEFGVLAAIIFMAIAIPLIRDMSIKIVDRYVYRIRANFRRTVVDASQLLTRMVGIDTHVAFLTRTIFQAFNPQGIAVYLANDGAMTRFSAKVDERGHLSTPDAAPESIVRSLEQIRTHLVSENLGRFPVDSLDETLQTRLSSMNWALVSPLLSDGDVLGVVAIGPKLSGDPYYPQDLDLLTTLANQAGIGIKNAQLYAEVVLAHEYIENIVATINSGVVAVDASGRITLFNRAAEQLTGLTAAGARQQPVDILAERLREPLQLAVRENRVVTEPEIALSDGTVIRPVICTASPLHDATGATVGSVVVFSDLTPLRQLELERRRAEKLAYLETLASGLAHEIRNPLVAIKTFAQLIPRRHTEAGFVLEFNRVATREIERMEGLIERLRTLAQPSRRVHVVIDLREPVQEALDVMAVAFAEKGIVCTVRLGGVPATILGDGDELKQLMLNLLMNAHDATSPGGALTVELTAAPKQVTLSVADSGPGIPPEILPRIFDPFVTTKPHGTGLGLAICSGIAAAHGAKLHAANGATGGALFTVEFRAETVIAPGTAT